MAEESDCSKAVEDAAAPRLSHVDETGEARMVDVSGKQPTVRTARVGARVWMAPETLRLLKEQALPKGDVLTVAKVAGVMAAKRTSELIPLCHPIALTQVDLSFSIAEDRSRIDIECVTRTEDRTGVEMEALIGASVAATTIYDMCKAVDRGMVVGDLRLLEKTGGKEDYVRLAGRSSTVGQDVAPSSPSALRPVPSLCPPLLRLAPWWPSTSASPRGSARRLLRMSCCAPSTASRATHMPVPGTAR